MKNLKFLKAISLCVLCVLVFAQVGVFNADAAEPCTHENVVDLPAVQATCTTPGKTAGKTCNDCGLTLQAQSVLPVAPNNHGNVVDLPAVMATCTTPGKTAGQVCNDCGKTIQAQSELPVAPNNHGNVVDLPAVAATCTSTGLTAGKKCNDCGVVTVPQEEIAALGHTEETIPAVIATCKNPAYKEGTKCSVCNETLVAPEKIGEAVDHSYGTDGKCEYGCGTVKPTASSTAGLDKVPKTGDITNQVMMSVVAVISVVAAAAFVFSRKLAK